MRSNYFWVANLTQLELSNLSNIKIKIQKGGKVLLWNQVAILNKFLASKPPGWLHQIFVVYSEKLKFKFPKWLLRFYCWLWQREKSIFLDWNSSIYLFNIVTDWPNFGWNLLLFRILQLSTILDYLLRPNLDQYKKFESHLEI